MKPMGAFGVPAWWMAGARLARVTSVDDPLSLSRIRIRLLGEDVDGTGEIWARVATGFAGDNYGAFMIPGEGEEVLVLFVGSNADAPVVVGALWNGATGIPEQIGGDRVDRWSFTGKAGTRIAIVESAAGEETVEIETPAGVRATLTDGGGQSIRLECGTSTLTMDAQGISLDTGGTLAISASTVTIDAGMMDVTSAIAKFSAVVQGDTILSNTVISGTYTPGAGNIW